VEHHAKARQQGRYIQLAHHALLKVVGLGKRGVLQKVQKPWNNPHLFAIPLIVGFVGVHPNAAVESERFDLLAGGNSYFGLLLVRLPDRRCLVNPLSAVVVKDNHDVYRCGHAADVADRDLIAGDASDCSRDATLTQSP